MTFSTAYRFLLLFSAPALVKSLCTPVCSCKEAGRSNPMGGPTSFCDSLHDPLAGDGITQYDLECVDGLYPTNPGYKYSSCNTCSCCDASTATLVGCGSIPTTAESNPTPTPTPAPAPSTPNTPTGGGVSADPHATSLGGGKWDLRGKDDTSFALWAAAKLQVNGMTKERTFKKKGGQIVSGSCFVRVACKVAVDADTTLHVQLLAEQPSSFRMYLNDNATGLYANRTNVELSDVSLSITPNKGDFVLINNAIKLLVQWRQFRAPLNAAGQTVPENDQSRWYLDVSFRALNDTMPSVAPHGLIGQSFDGSTLTVHGKRDNYGRGRFFKTSAQGEGAIEGTYTDYVVASPFATSFKFARFGSLGPIAPRNVSMLTGRKEPKVVGVAAGSVEDADA